jgi:hypothetical protein
MHTTFQQIMLTTFQQIRNGIFLGVVSIGSILAVFLVLFGLVWVLPPLPSPVLFVLTIAFGLLGLGLGLLTVRLKETRIEKTCGENMTLIRDYKEPRVYQAAFEAAMEIFELTKEFPPEEKYSMTDQVRDHRVPLARILPLPGERGAIRQVLSASLVTPKKKRRKHVYGCSLPSDVAICRRRRPRNWRTRTIKSLGS